MKNTSPVSPPGRPGIHSLFGDATTTHASTSANAPGTTCLSRRRLRVRLPPALASCSSMVRAALSPPTLSPRRFSVQHRNTRSAFPSANALGTTLNQRSRVRLPPGLARSSAVRALARLQPTLSPKRSTPSNRPNAAGTTFQTVASPHPTCRAVRFID